MYKYEQHTASLLCYDELRRFMLRRLAETTAAFKAARQQSSGQKGYRGVAAFFAPGRYSRDHNP
jgi:hypothetical protein